MPKLYWEYRPEWAAWWLMTPIDGLTAQKGYGPFQNDFEVRMASEVHNVAPPMGLAVA